MIVKYSTGTITKVIDIEDNKEEIEDMLEEAEEKSKIKKEAKQAPVNPIPFWLEK